MKFSTSLIALGIAAATAAMPHPRADKPKGKWFDRKSIRHGEKLNGF
jgi:hypothetical protein